MEHPALKALFLSRLSVQRSFQFPPRLAAFLTVGKDVKQESELAKNIASLVAIFKETWV